ncbi:MAG TPA: efflux RND transporter periplasmic adaptor subunit [bacterium]|nr:efflux RND transporter periplasmic adaptor subunit [bacterium]HQI47489.1 efflux RND transporter periplasmic adaptor subunit [bacterium]HQJ65755.1 efflux RND transporter periplasmic adaptor subunit [bacterium]
MLKLKEISRKRWFWPGLIALLLLFWLLGSRSKEGAGGEPVWGDLRKGDFVIDAVETGEIEAVHSVDLAPPMEWRMDMQIIAMVPEGSIVKQGDFLVQFDTSELEDRLELAQDALAALLAQRDGLRAQQSARIAQLKADIAAAGYSQEVAVLQRELLQYEAAVRRMDAELEEKKAQISLEETKTSLESQEIIDSSALSTLGVDIAKARANVRELEDKIKSLTLRAPIGGLVVYNEIGFGDSRKKIAIGDKPNPGQPVISIPNLDSIQVKLRINEMDAARLSIGQQATIRLDAYPERSFSGRVLHIARLAQKEDWDSEIKDFEVLVRLAQSDPVLKPGMTARVQIELGVEKDALTAPTGAIFERQGERVVFPRTNYPKPQPVETGPRNDLRMVIRNSRLKEGDLVACSPPDTSYHRLGFSTYLAASTGKPEKLAADLAEMEKRGLAFDYDANRNRRVIARAPNGAAGDYEALRGRIPGMTPDGRPMEIDPATMKKLQEAIRGMQPGPGGLPPGPAMRPGGPNVPSGLVTGDTSRRLLQQRGRGLPPGYAPGDTTRPHRPAGALPSQKLRRNIP